MTLKLLMILIKHLNIILNKMKTVTTTYYLYDELLDDHTKREAVHNFKLYGGYQYAYAWSDEKAIDTIRKEQYYFNYLGELA